MLPQGLAVADLDQLFGRNSHQADRAAHAVQSAGLLQGSGDAQQGCGLGVVAAGVDKAGLRVTLRMGRDDQAVQLTHDEQFGAGFARVDIGVEARDVARLCQLIAQLFILLFQISMGLPFPIASLRVLPNVALRGEHQVTLASYDVFQLLDTVLIQHIDPLLFLSKSCKQRTK